MAPRLLSATSLAIAAALGTGPAWALGFGSVRATAIMGQVLDATVPLRLQTGETVSESCLSATVTSGDVPVPAGAVVTSLLNSPSGDWRVRIRTTQRIDEPFVTITVNITCDGRLSRQFTVFADPPGTLPSLDSTAVAAALPANPAPASEPAPSAGVAAGAAVAPPPSSARASSGMVQNRPAPKPKPVIVANPSRAAAVAQAPVLPPAPPAPSRPAPKSPEPEATKVSGGAILKGEVGARLRLDAPNIAPSNEEAFTRLMRQRAEAMKTAEIAVDVATAANASAEQKVAAMEATLAAARKEAADAKSALAQMREEQANADLLETWAPWLAAVCAVLLGVATLLFMRLRRADAERLQGWLDERGPRTRHSEFDTVAPVTQQFPQDAVSTFAAPLSRSGTDEFAEPPTLAPLPSLPTAPVAFPETQPSSTLELNQNSQGHDISIEELLDVEQQAEFFVVLGQDDAAIDLLTSHVMASGGASPMPYLKLLEIYRRIGDQTSYERTRKRFNARFNGLAPDWSADPNGGRALDEYPDVMAYIQKVWPSPVDAMAELQTLMFRNDSNRLFELPAYRDIMLLFTLARDLHDANVGDDHTPVDVLLPLNNPNGAATAAVRDSQFGPLNEVAMDLDLPTYSLPGEKSARGAVPGRR